METIKNIAIAAIIFIIAILGLGFIYQNAHRALPVPPVAVEPVDVAPAGTVDRPLFSETQKPTGESYGTKEFRLGETISYGEARIRAVSVVEDSRCPYNARCVWAGRARIEFAIDSAAGSLTRILELGQSTTTPTLSLRLESVLPEKTAGKETLPADYVFTLTVEKR